MGYKNFITGAVLSESDLDDFLMEQTVMQFASAVDRSSQNPPLNEGTFTYLRDTNEVEVYNGSTWAAVFRVVPIDGMRIRRLGVGNTDPTSGYVAHFSGGLDALGGLRIDDGANHLVLFDLAGTPLLLGAIGGSAGEGLVLDGRGTFARITFKVGGVKLGELDNGRLILAGIAPGTSQGAGSRLEVENNDATSFLARLNSVANVASSAVRNLVLLIGSNSTSPTTGDHWLTFEKGDGVNVGSVNGTGGDSVAYSTTSDERLKTHVTELADPIAFFEEIKVRRFTWDSSDYPDVGLFAQDVHALFPEAVTPGSDAGPDEDGFEPWSLDVPKLVMVLIRRVQAMQHEIDQLQRDIE